MKAEQILLSAVDLITGDRAKSHGPKLENHLNIAYLWNGYLRGMSDYTLTPADVAIMMALLKIARTKTGEENIDDFVDGAAYITIAGELSNTNDD